MAEAAPHHLELIDQLLVQGTHFWVHQLLVHGQADPEDVNLTRRDDANKPSEEVGTLTELSWPLVMEQQILFSHVASPAPASDPSAV